MAEAFEALAEELRAFRSVGVCAVARAWVGRDGPDAARLRLLRELGYRDCRSWDPIPADTARTLLTWLLHRDLAYDARFADPDRAAALADRFVTLCGDGAWRTNGDQVQRRLEAAATGASGFAAGWDPLTEATFDSGVFFEGPKFVAIAWVEDED